MRQDTAAGEVSGAVTIATAETYVSPVGLPPGHEDT